MWHGLTSGEPDANVEVVFSDIISWLNKRAGEEEGEGEAIRTEYNFKPIQGSTTTATNTTVEASSPAKLDPQKPCRKSRSQGKYLCGWRGRRMHHHSSMQICYWQNCQWRNFSLFFPPKLQPCLLILVLNFQFLQLVFFLSLIHI